ncbi:flagellar filament capping protein FliD [Undibacterium sp. Jales W-56]|uniref:flagellar filament capping protein FliD n=1 Tax=Undibacterium sp. Jales W-56 TaxID=2897325 RepID=UPI0021D02916|nr:flagellar filament capping protein FliD [Undibacterium sp. Jales W-56]MCU6435379.1 flagellar filament capping protein FliD [Undibacterium sp. Jales W-56]
MGIQSTGIGSGLDVNSLIAKLMQVESQPLTTLAKKEASFQAKLSGYGLLQGALSGFQTSLSSLSSPTVFQTLAASSSDATIATATATSAATAGLYNVTVNSLAQGQSLSSAGRASSTAAIGGGAATTVTFTFGTITGTPTGGTYPAGTTFAQDTTRTIGTVTIDSTNNSLQGIRDAINKGNFGVTASIVGDGSANPYHLVLNSTTTGASSSLKITTSGDATIGSLLNYDPTGVQNFTEVVTAQNASLKVNGINITSASNNVATAIQGLTISLAKVGTTAITVANNTTAVQTNITSFVKAFNDLNSTIANLTSFDPATKKGGILLGDATTQSIQNQLRRTLATAVNGLGGGITSLAQIGITFQKDGSLAVDSTKLSAALTANYSDIGGLFASIGKATDSLVSVTGSTSATKGGTYALNVTQLATQGLLTGNVVLPGSTTIAANTTLSVTLDGINASVAIAAGSYTPTQLAAIVQSSINGTAAFTAVGSAISASVNGAGQLALQSNKYGTVSNVSLANGTGTTVASFTGTALNGTAGVDIAGTLNGLATTGSGQTLSGIVGTATEGLKILVSGGSLGARGTVNFSVGYAATLTTTLSGFLGSAGTIASTTDGVNRSIKDIGKQRDNLNLRLYNVEARYRAQFTSLDRVISGLNNTSTFLTQQLAALTGSK